MTASLSLHDIVKAYAGRIVLAGINATVPPGSRVGLIGENGSGKSTLLRIAAGVDEDYSGSVERPGDLGYLPQDIQLPTAATLGQVLHDALAPLHRAVSDLEEAASRLGGDDPQAATSYDELLIWAQARDAWDADRRAALAAARLGLDCIDPERSVGSLSGGQRARLALAAMLTRRPAALLLDEPTNHLDDDGLTFLQDQLCESAGAVLVASHDRVFLDAVCSSTLDLDPSHFGTDGSGGRTQTGGYTAYLSVKRASLVRWREAFEAQQDELSALRRSARTGESEVAHNRGPRDNDKFVYAFKGSRVQASVSRRRQNAERRIESLERERIPKPPTQLRFTVQFDAPTPATVQLRNIEVAGRLRVERLDLDSGDKLLVTGRNGAGKSTLLGVLAGTVQVDCGQVDVRARRVGLLTQDVNLTDLDRTAEQAYADHTAPPLRDLGLLHPRLLGVPLRWLSIGQLRRIELALLLADQPDLLLLDEPTNHLSLQLVEDLETALTRTPGTVIMASHDRWLRDRWPGTTLQLSAISRRNRQRRRNRFKNLY